MLWSNLLLSNKLNFNSWKLAGLWPQNYRHTLRAFFRGRGRRNSTTPIQRRGEVPEILYSLLLLHQKSWCVYIAIFLSAHSVSYGVGTPAFYSCGPFSVFSLGNVSNDILFCWNKSGVSILTHSGQKRGCEQHFVVFIAGFFSTEFRVDSFWIVFVLKN